MIFAIVGSVGLLVFWWLRGLGKRAPLDSLEALDEAEEELMERTGLNRRARREKVDRDTVYAATVASAAMLLLVLVSAAGAALYGHSWRLQLASGLGALIVVLVALAVVMILRRRRDE